MNLIQAIQILCTHVDYGISEDSESIRDLVEDASILVQKEMGFDSNDTKIRLLNNELPEWKGVGFSNPPKMNLSIDAVERLKSSMRNFKSTMIEIAHDDSEELRKNLEWALKWVGDHPYSSVQEEALKIKQKWGIS